MAHHHQDDADGLDDGEGDVSGRYVGSGHDGGMEDDIKGRGKGDGQTNPRNASRANGIPSSIRG